jgi:hypothetical protein
MNKFHYEATLTPGLCYGCIFWETSDPELRLACNYNHPFKCMNINDRGLIVKLSKIKLPLNIEIL